MEMAKANQDFREPLRSHVTNSSRPTTDLKVGKHTERNRLEKKDTTYLGNNLIVNGNQFKVEIE